MTKESFFGVSENVILARKFGLFGKGWVTKNLKYKLEFRKSTLSVVVANFIYINIKFCLVSQS